MPLKQIFPILDWLPNYRKAHLSADISAGLTVGVMLIPQGMAYAMIAGLPPVYGLYASLIPQIIYAVFGTSRQLSVGPVAMDSLLVAAGVSAMAALGTEEYIMLAVSLSLLMGLVQVAFGTLRLGFLVNFLSKPVVSGFTSAAALIIGMNQLKHIVGIDLARSNNIFSILWETIQRVGQVNIVSVAIALAGVLIIKNIKKLHPSIPGALVAVVLGIVAVRLGGLEAHGVKIVGAVPSGLPPLKMPEVSWDRLGELAPMSLTLALIAFMEAISVAKALQQKHKGEYQLDNNQEMIGLGMANVVGSFFGCYPTTGGFSRSAVNDQAGAKTNLAAVISAMLIGLTLLFLTPYFYHLPQAILGAIIMVAVFGLVDYRYPKFLWKTKRDDFFMLLITFAVTLGLGIKEGIGAGVLISLGMMIYRSTSPHIAVLGRLPDTRDYRNVQRFKQIEVRPDILVLRHDAQLFFANTDNFIYAVKAEVSRKSNALKLVVLHCGSIPHIDATALQALEELTKDLQGNGVQIAFSGLIGPVRDFLSKTGFIDELGKDHFFVDVQSAIDHFDGCEECLGKLAFQHATQTDIFKENL